MEPEAMNRTTDPFRRAPSKLKLALLGALAAGALFAVPIGARMALGPNKETAGAVSGPTLDCGSPRDAWRPDCRTARAAPTRDADVTGSIGEETAAGKAQRRSIAPATARPDADASASPASASPREPRSAPSQPQRLVQANPEPVRPEPNPSDGPEAQPWRDPAPAPSAQGPSAPARPSPATSQGEPARGAGETSSRAEPAEAAAPARGTDAVKPSPHKSVPSEAAKPEAAPAREARRLAAERRAQPDDEAEPASGPTRRALRRAARSASARAAPARPKAKAVAKQDDDEPVATVRRRARPVRDTLAETRRSARVARLRPPSRAALRRGPPDRAYASTGGLRVSSVQTYYLPDGRRVVVNVRPRPGVVRALAAQHAAAFSSRRASATPSWGRPAWGGWFGAGFDD